MTAAAAAARPLVASEPPSKRGALALGRSRAETAWLVIPPLVFFAVSLVLPLASLFLKSVDSDQNTYAAAFESSVFLSALLRTVVMAAIVTVLTVVLGVLYATAIASAPGWLQIVLMSALLLSLWTSIMVRTFGWMLLQLPRGAIYWALSSLGLSDEPVQLYQTTIAMYPAMVAVMLPFAVLPILNGIRAVDREQLNAATVFGAGPFMTMRRVILPVITPSMISAAVLVFVVALGFYVTPLLLGGPMNLTVSGVINSQLNLMGQDEVGAAMSILLVSGTVLIYLVADRLFRVSEKWG